ncbi:glycosyltransferase family 4 protein [Chloroflexota bacterium]
MRVCLISVEIFAWGKYGGFGRATRLIGGELAKRGVEVYAVVPRREGQQPVEDLDGIRVLSFKPRDFLTATKLFREANADIYHSQEPSMGTYLAQRAMPDRKHIMTFRDPRDIYDWRVELSMPSLNSLQVLANWLYEDNFLVGQAVRNGDGWFTIGKYLIPKVKAKYRMKGEPEFLPTPVAVPDKIEKAKQPTICYVNRWDRRKRPELFFDMVKSFPDVKFLAVGKSRSPDWERYLREKYGNLPNLDMVGFIDQFATDKHHQILEESWVFVNTAAREALPNAFIEAAAHGCAILSSLSPDGFSKEFGYFAAEDDFVKGLQVLLENDYWKEQGAKGRKYIQEVFQLDKSLDRHLTIYERLTGIPRPEVSDLSNAVP